MIKLGKITVFLALAYALAAPFALQAQTEGVTLINPLKNCEDIYCPINAFITFLYYVGPPIAVIMVLIGAFQILTAGSNPQKIAAGKKTITYAVVGLGIILIAGGLRSLIEDLLQKAN